MQKMIKVNGIEIECPANVIEENGKLFLVINGTPVKTIPHNGKDVEYDLAKYAEQYDKRKTLPSTHVFCTKSGTLITCFGNNLHGKVARHGGIWELLTGFVCKAHGGSGQRTVKVPTTAAEIQAEMEKMQARLEVLKKQEQDAKSTPAPAEGEAEGEDEGEDEMSEEDIKAQAELEAEEQHEEVGAQS